MDPLGASPGKMDGLSSQGLVNDFSTIPNTDMDSILAADRLIPRQMSSGVMRGTQRVVNTDGSYITLGEIPGTGGEFGIAFFDSTGAMLRKDTGTASTIYNSGVAVMTTDTTGLLFRDSSNRRIKIGKSPDDGRIGSWLSKVGQDVITLLGGV